MSGAGPLGDTVSVSGTLTPYVDVTTEHVRLRLLNASRTRVHRFGLTDGRPFALVATDGGLLAEPHRADRVSLSPGDAPRSSWHRRRANGSSCAATLPDSASTPWNRRLAGGDGTLDILQLRAA
ncbi:hypothetical protein [Streptomyces sp. NPDC057438]|uniref:hypothetical protein n=1 Tax=Streptomyces sp. NPDC057438 TaxID=3346133 RepID=UPI0036B01FE1